MPPAGLGLAIGGASIAAYTAAAAASGRSGTLLAGGPESQLFRGVITILALLAYVPTAQVYLARWTRDHVESLRPLLRAPGPPPPIESGLSRRAGVIGSLACVLFFLVLPSGSRAEPPPFEWCLDYAMLWWTLPLLGWGGARLGHAIVGNALYVSRLAERLAEIDLFDLRRLAPFGRHGLQSALLAILLLSISAALLVHPGPALPSVVLSGTLLLGVSVAALLLPVLGLRGRIGRQRSRELTALRAEIETDRRRLLDRGPGERAAAARLPALLALESRLEAVNPWPLELLPLWRYALYVSLGLGSWVGAAAVEWLLGELLG